MTNQQLIFLYLDIGMALFLLLPRIILAEACDDCTSMLTPAGRVYAVVVGSALLICIWPCLLVSAATAIFRR